MKATPKLLVLEEGAKLLSAAKLAGKVWEALASKKTALPSAEPALPIVLEGKVTVGQPTPSLKETAAVPLKEKPSPPEINVASASTEGGSSGFRSGHYLFDVSTLFSSMVFLGGGAGTGYLLHEEQVHHHKLQVMEVEHRHQMETRAANLAEDLHRSKNGLPPTTYPGRPSSKKDSRPFHGPRNPGVREGPFPPVEG